MAPLSILFGLLLSLLGVLLYQMSEPAHQSWTALIPTFFGVALIVLGFLAFKEKMRLRNAIEGTQSELVRAHGLRQARYRGLAKAKLQNYFIGTACNIKRWLRRLAWQLEQTTGAANLHPSPAAL